MVANVTRVLQMNMYYTYRNHTILTGLLFTVNYDSCETHYKGYYFNLPSSGIAQTLA